MLSFVSMICAISLSENPSYTSELLPLRHQKLAHQVQYRPRSSRNSSCSEAGGAAGLRAGEGGSVLRHLSYSSARQGMYPLLRALKLCGETVQPAMGHDPRQRLVTWLRDNWRYRAIMPTVDECHLRGRRRADTVRFPVIRQLPPAAGPGHPRHKYKDPVARSAVTTGRRGWRPDLGQ